MISFFHKTTSTSKSIWEQVILTGLKVFLVAGSTLILAATYQPAMASGLTGKGAEIINLTNQLRQVRGISILESNSALTASAQAKAEDMADNGYFGHADAYGNHMGYWMQSAGYTYLRAGENLAKGYTNSKTLIQAWTNSPTHYANLVNTNYRDIGIGIAEGYIDGHFTTFVVQHLGELMPGTSIFSVKQKSTNSAVQVLGDQSTMVSTGGTERTVLETMTEVSSSGSNIVNKTPAGLLWVAYLDAKNIIKQAGVPTAFAWDINFGLPQRGYQSAQILSVVLAFLGFLGWLTMLVQPFWNGLLAKIKKA